MLLEIGAVSFRYNSHPVLHDVSFSVQPGELVGIVGPNGAGKSTLLEIISRRLTPTAGSVTIADRAIHHIAPAEFARHLAIVRQRESVAVDFTVEEVVLLGRLPYLGRFSRESQHDRKVAAEAMQAAGIAHLAQRTVSQLSGGEFQRVALARALAQETPILLLDEPTNNLDLRYQVEVLQLLNRLAAAGRTLIVTLHDLNLAGQYCHRLILLHNGRIRMTGAPADVLTPSLLAEVYGVPAVVIPHPATGKPLVFPDVAMEESQAGASSPRGEGQSRAGTDALNNEVEITCAKEAVR